ncbi:Glycosyltransferase family 92 protein [Caenorhabditis elegans]|uniref:Glycosyltransferase family 92 protein n=1 Tax=Caenorhabditis elegans TaxID=6239 RepID=O02308_CAEEL|nr:Glycosyltransferase family 92 protein [Caenorhabditis elegans]CAB03535.3 Glycosyltransferase family 92 protein [Caenorhabditis elegans]
MRCSSFYCYYSIVVLLLVFGVFNLFKDRDEKETVEIGKFRGIYVQNAYRVSDEEVRFFYLENQDNRVNLKSQIPLVGWKPIRWFCLNTTCSDYFYCSMATRFGSVSLPPHSPHQLYINLSTEGNNEYTVVPVKDVRPGPTYSHTLGVCLQPIFFFTDWTIVIQFLESWIAQGATKFYFYLHSYTWQTKKVLDFYKESLGDDLELVEWSDLPVHSKDRGNYDSDPNSRVFRHGAIAFMHDCMLRARSVVKFVANTDLDDFPVSSTLNISDNLNYLSIKYPNAAQFKVDWLLSHQKQNWGAVDTPRDMGFSLESVRVLQNESIRWDYRTAKKLIHRPERVVHFDMHSVFQNEVDSVTKNQYSTIDLLGSSDLYFLHLRRFEQKLVTPHDVFYNNRLDTNLLLKLKERMLDQYSERINGTRFADTILSPWSEDALNTMRDLEQCRCEAFGTVLNHKNQICQQSSAGCEGMLTSGISFIKTRQTWKNINRRGRYNNYFEKPKSYSFFSSPYFWS